MVEFLQPADAVRGDPGEHVALQHEAPQGPLQAGEGQGGDGVEFVTADLQTPGPCTVHVRRNNPICQPTHISQLPHRKLPQSISGQREGEDASVFQLRWQVGQGDVGAVDSAQVLTGVGAKAVGAELAGLHLPPVQYLGGGGQTGQQQAVQHKHQPERHPRGHSLGGLRIINNLVNSDHKVELNGQH